MKEIISIEKISKLNGILEKPLLGLIYGSRKKDSDKDIFLIYEKPIEKNIFINNFDFNQIDFKKFKEKIFYRDIEYTEPILTGEYFLGDRKILDNSIKFLHENQPEENIYDYLKKRSIETFLQASSFYSKGKEEMFIKMAYSNFPPSKIKKNLFENNLQFHSEIFNKSLSTLTYSLSYLSSIYRYKNREKFVTVNELMDNPKNKMEETFSNLRKYFKSCSKKLNSLSFDKIDAYFEEAKYLLKEFV